jgi:hypothetical protein
MRKPPAKRGFIGKESFGNLESVPYFDFNTGIKLMQEDSSS